MKQRGTHSFLFVGSLTPSGHQSSMDIRFKPQDRTGVGSPCLDVHSIRSHPENMPMFSNLLSGLSSRCLSKRCNPILTPGTPSVQKNPDVSAILSSKPSDSTAKASPSITNLPIPSSPSVAPVSEETLASPDVTDFKLVSNQKRLKKNSPTKSNNTIAKAEKMAKFYSTSHLEATNPIPTKDNISTHQSALKPFPTTTPTSVDIDLLPIAVLPPLEKILLQSRESDADAEMSSSSASEEDALEYNMSEDLEDSPAVISPPPASKPEKVNKYKNR
ncbi:hypothetical protein AVEN_176760-1 [Araneus ventricosus]|uniref:Uncharacterized protein n=1 Tax=Araneus ventricosus TaxID=182803 RepID=A0A4Y2QB80_ARAVE|nr:hypothetical protein AVEN_70661-1 [Araneus ventricosus]GBN60482.1 hypothetical protein AVEN_176760-1 [Araneus ventricosus]